MQATQPDEPWSLLLGPDGDTAPGVSQIGSGPLEVSQASAGDGGHGGGHALVVSDELGGREAVLASPLVPVAQAEGLGQQGPLGGQPTGLVGLLPCGRLLGMPAIPTSTDQSSEQVPSQHDDPAAEHEEEPESDQQPGQGAHWRRDRGH